MQIELWQLISLAATFLGVLITLGRVLLAQIDKRLEARFSMVERDLHQVRNVERDLLQLKADLPRHYVLREDYVRNQTIIEAKLDALALRFENFHLKQTPRNTP